MPSERNIALREKYEKLLEEKKNLLFTRYTGLNVQEITDLRKKLKKEGMDFLVVKNKVLSIALKNKLGNSIPYRDLLKGPLGAIFIKDDVPKAAKIVEDFAKEHEKLEFAFSIVEGKFYEKEDTEKFSKMPTRDESLAMLASLVQAPTQKIAAGIQEIMASLARAIKQSRGEKWGKILVFFFTIYPLDKKRRRVWQRW